MGAALRVALEQESRDFLDEQRDAARSFAYSVDHLVGQRMSACDLSDHAILGQPGRPGPVRLGWSP